MVRYLSVVIVATAALVLSCSLRIALHGSNAIGQQTGQSRDLDYIGFSTGILTLVQCVFVCLILLANLPEDSDALFVTQANRIPIRPPECDYLVNALDGVLLELMLVFCNLGFITTAAASMPAAFWHTSSIVRAVVALQGVVFAISFVIVVRLNKPERRKSYEEVFQALKAIIDGSGSKKD